MLLDRQLNLTKTETSEEDIEDVIETDTGFIALTYNPGCIKLYSKEMKEIQKLFDIKIPYGRHLLYHHIAVRENLLLVRDEDRIKLLTTQGHYVRSINLPPHIKSVRGI